MRSLEHGFRESPEPERWDGPKTIFLLDKEEVLKDWAVSFAGQDFAKLVRVDEKGNLEDMEVTRKELEDAVRSFESLGIKTLDKRSVKKALSNYESALVNMSHLSYQDIEVAWSCGEITREEASYMHGHKEDDIKDTQKKIDLLHKILNALEEKK